MTNQKRLSQRQRRHKESGMTLVEVLIAIFIFAIGIMAVAMMSGNALTYSASARHTTEASEIAQHKLESLLKAPYHHSDLDASVNPHGPVVVGSYKLSWEVAEDVPMTQMKTIHLNVAWKEHGATKRLVIDAIRQ